MRKPRNGDLFKIQNNEDSWIFIKGSIIVYRNGILYAKSPDAIQEGYKGRWKEGIDPIYAEGFFVCPCCEKAECFSMEDIVF